jgi:hypothetical protein
MQRIPENNRKNDADRRPGFPLNATQVNNYRTYYDAPDPSCASEFVDSSAMFCRGCDYNLVGVAARRCPECGRTFDPSDAATFADFPGQLALGPRRAILAVCGLGVLLPVLAVLRSDPPFLIMLVAAGPGLLAAITVLAGMTLWPARSSRLLIGLAVLPAAIVLMLMGSLAVHMRVALDGWPASIGTRGFPASLRWHATLAMEGWSVVLLATVFLWPVAVLLCGAVPSWRRFVLPLGLFAVAHAICFGLVFLAPKGFVIWLMD